LKRRVVRVADEVLVQEFSGQERAVADLLATEAESAVDASAELARGHIHLQQVCDELVGLGQRRGPGLLLQRYHGQSRVRFFDCHDRLRHCERQRSSGGRERLRCRWICRHGETPYLESAASMRPISLSSMS